MAETLDAPLPRDLQDKARRVLDRACEREMPLTTAESCTGGLLAALLTDIPGCSHIFERGFVSYSDASKCDLLDVASDKVETCGAVSKDVAVAMADGALARSGAGVALSITGYAGPPAPDDPDGEEGLVHFACARKGATPTHREERFGPVGRDGVRVEALKVALQMIEDALNE